MNYPLRIITVGEKDASVVKEIQKQLNKVGCGPLKVDGDFGKNTLSAVKAFQSWHCDSFNNPLIIDGKVGQITWASLFGIGSKVIATSSVVRNKVLNMARNEIGVREDPPGSNKGPRVEEYLKTVNRKPGDAWCAAFVYWCFQQVCAENNSINPLVKTGLCMSHWRNTTGVKILSKDAVDNPTLIEPGYVFIINHGNGKGHTGLVTSVQNGFIGTIEGNTNNDNSPEGVGVFELYRKINTISAGFIKYF